jgi:hypothetical protein
MRPAGFKPTIPAGERQQTHALDRPGTGIVTETNTITNSSFFVFCFSGEEPRSRRYGRTAVMRLIVQPCDEDEDDDYFLSFS